MTDVLDYNDMRGFVATLDKGGGDCDAAVYALDCEMCNTVRGNELTRVTVIDLEGKTKYETLVKPQYDIIDYNTRYVSSFCALIVFALLFFSLQVQRHHRVGPRRRDHQHPRRAGRPPLHVLGQDHPHRAQLGERPQGTEGELKHFHFCRSDSKELSHLQMLHQTVVDTSVVFPHKMGKPYKRALRMLAAEHLKRIIQNDGEFCLNDRKGLHINSEKF